MSQNYLVHEIILKFHRGEPLTDEEQAILDAELVKLPVEKVWERIRAHVETRQDEPIIRWYTRWPAVAAAVVLLAVGGLYLYSSLPRKSPTVLAVLRSVAPGHFTQDLEGPQGIEIVDSASGGQSVPYPVTLPDGSTVTLSYGSSVRYAKGFEMRKVVVSGQAYFDVTHDPRPFVVEAGKDTVQVLGTQFNVMNYPGMPQEITLLDGKIALERGTLRKVMQPKERAVIREGKQVLVSVQPMARPEDVVAWMGKRPEIVFESTDLYVVIQRLAEYYQVGFHVAPELQTGWPTTWTVDLGQPRAVNLAAINDIVKTYAKVTEKDGVIEVTK